ncbi:MAG TPA: GAF domain-containing sensor histidine kinase [Thermoanaerobaculia bacterium]
MLSPPLPQDELARLRALEALHILDTAPEAAYDDLTRLASIVCGTPIALVSLVDASRQWFKSRIGLCASETPREVAMCAHAIVQEGLFIVRDTLEDGRFADNPLTTGEPHIRFYAGAPLITRAGYKLGTLCVIDRVPRDLTETQQDALRVLARQVVTHLELRELVDEANDARARLARMLEDSEAAHLVAVAQRQEIERMKNGFVSTVSHELRTPLTSIHGSLGLLASGVMGELSGDARKLVTIAERNSVRLISLINDILDFDNLTSGTMELALRPASVAGIVDRSIASVSAFAAQEGVELRTEISGETVFADEDRLAQVLVNLLSNAVKFSPRGAAVTLRTVARDGALELRVEDHGRGIAEEARAKLFQSFQQLDSSDSRGKGGTGLGLAICRAIVEQHGGTLGVESVEGEGSVFWLRLPRANGIEN